MLELSCDVHLVYVLCTWCIPLYSNQIDYLSKNEALRGSNGAIAWCIPLLSGTASKNAVVKQWTP